MATEGTTHRLVEYGARVTYEGELSNSNGRKKGVGTLTLADGKVYSGRFDNGYCDGVGVLTYDDNSSYRGEFREGKFHGFGELRQGSSTFQGKFVTGQVTSGRLQTTVGKRLMSVSGSFANGSVSRMSESSVNELVSKAVACAEQADKEAARCK
ncbi:MORN repeat-containing protein 4-like [Sycon ciliatum]|uniref:MORN repeat-containing protein 4-like n=1 Tax=Sycon ciliatum TaxID=27933 RepID=UPI0020AE3D01|eukprot:scpid59283/ scgid21924/ MORN repeat-containing protein 4